MRVFSKRLAIDMGTNHTRIYLDKKKIAVDQPSIMAVAHNDDRILAIGEQAAKAAGRQNQGLSIIKPISRGVIAKYTETVTMLKHFVSLATGRFNLFSPDALFVIPGSATSTEAKALIDAANEAKLGEVHLIHTGIAAALGAGIDIHQAKGQMIVNIGAEITEVAVLSLGSIVASKSFQFGGEDLTQAIMRSIRTSMGVKVGHNTAEEIKLLASTLSSVRESSIKVGGKNLISGKIGNLEVHSDDIRSVLEASMEKVIIAVRQVLEKTPPDLVADIADNGIMLTGGTAALDGLEEYLSRRIGTKCYVSQDPYLCCVKGAYIALTHLDDYRSELFKALE